MIPFSKPNMLRPLLRLWAALLVLAAVPAWAETRCAGPAAICGEAQAGSLPLISDGRALSVLIDGSEEDGVLRAIGDLQADLGRVSGQPPAMLSGKAPETAAAVIVGTIGRSPIIDRLIREGRIDAIGIAGAWEGYLHQIVERPAPGIGRALVIAGADKRGTIFGAYHLSERIGVSPWHWWADVPVARKTELHVLPGRLTEKPAVKYRGIFGSG